MKQKLVVFGVIICLLLCLASGTWWGWRQWYSGEQLLAACEKEDWERVKWFVILGTDVNHRRPAEQCGSGC